MGLSDVKLLYVCSCLVLGLIILSPTLAMVVRLPGGEKFSELYILGPGHMAEGYPFNVSAGGSYRIFLGIGNHMGGLESYVVYVKFRNQNESLPDSVNGTASTLAPLLEYRALVQDGGIWEKEVSFSPQGVSVEGNFCRVSGLVIDGVAFAADRATSWSEQESGFLFELFFELWRYDESTLDFEYHNRFVGIWLNMTVNM